MDKKKIIIVDDNATSLKICTVILQPHYAVMPVLSAAKMFEVLRAATPDLIILDIEMPEINGFEALRQLKADAASVHIPVAFLTSHVDYDSEKRGRDMGVIDYFRKPVSQQALLRRVSAIFSTADTDTTDKILSDIQDLRRMLQSGGRNQCL